MGKHPQAPKIYMSRLKRALRYARATIKRFHKYGADKRFFKLRDHFDAAKQRLCALSYSPELTDEQKVGVLQSSMGLTVFVEQIDAMVRNANRTYELPGGSSPALGEPDDKHYCGQFI